MTPVHRLTFIFAGAVVSLIQGCAATQNAANTIQMVDVISRIRNQQVVRNLGAFIVDHDAVPSQIVLVTGQANVAVGYQPTLKATNVNRVAALEADAGMTDQWTAQWQFTAITDPNDLRGLRNLYALVMSTDQQYRDLLHLTTQFESKATTTPTDSDEVFQRLFSLDGGTTEPSKTNSQPADVAINKSVHSGLIVDWQTAKRFITTGDSIGCQIFQKERSDESALPFRRWLFWRGPSEKWQPAEPPIAAAVNRLGKLGNLEIMTISKACFNDFVILVQALSPTTNEAAKQPPRYMLQ